MSPSSTGSGSNHFFSPSCPSDAQTGYLFPVSTQSPFKPQALHHDFLYPNSGFLFMESSGRENLFFYFLTGKIISNMHFYLQLKKF